MSLIILPTTKPVSGVADLVVGQKAFGGVYAGRMDIDGILYALFAGPTTSQSTAYNLKTSNTTDGVAATNTYDGWTINALLNDAAHPAIQYARGLTIEGYNDWYIPSRDELELAMRSLASYAFSRTATTRAATNPGDTAGDKSGVNRRSSPARAGYATDFKDLTAASLVPYTGSIYISCTEVTGSPANMWVQNATNVNFQRGEQRTGSGKTGLAGSGIWTTNVVRRMKV